VRAQGDREYLEIHGRGSRRSSRIMGMVVLRSDSLGDEIQLRKDVFQFAETDFIRDSTSVITLLEGTILTSTFYFIPQSKLNILLVTAIKL
jgi:hypothetical protein